MPAERILLLFLHTGGGHLSAARALSEAIRELSPDAACQLFDPVEKPGGWWATFLEEGYRITAGYLRSMWIGAYEAQRLHPFRTLFTTTARVVMAPAIERKIREEGITRVIVLHHLLVTAARQAVRNIRDKDGRRVVACTVALDPFTLPPIWAHRAPFPMVVFSDQARRLALRAGAKAERVTVLPIVLKRKFDHPLARQQIEWIKSGLGFDAKKPLVLIAGGGEGFPRGEFYVEALASSSVDFQIAIICGKDALLKQKVERIAAEHPGRSISIYGFVDFMYELMNAADIILAKAGPATVMEALVLGKPLIITQYIYGQEKGNMRFVVENGLGFFLTDPERVGAAVERIFHEPERLERLRENIAKANLRNGSQEIASWALALR